MGPTKNETQLDLTFGGEAYRLVHGQITVSRPKIILGEKNKDGLWAVRTNIGHWSVEPTREAAVEEAERLAGRNRANPASDKHWTKVGVKGP